MDVQFRPRGQGWRGRGRPPRQVPAAVAELVAAAYEQRCDAAIPVGTSTAKEVREVVSLIRLAADQAGRVARVQYDQTEIRFYVEDKP